MSLASVPHFSSVEGSSLVSRGGLASGFLSGALSFSLGAWLADSSADQRDNGQDCNDNNCGALAFA